MTRFTAFWGRGVFALAAVLTLSALPWIAGGAETGSDPSDSGKPEAKTSAEYVFAVHPLHNPERLFAVYGPILRYLNARIPKAHFRLEASRNYEEFEKKLFSRAGPMPLRSGGFSARMAPACERKEFALHYQPQVDVKSGKILSAIAEGVEDGQALEVLRSHECDEVQGFYYAHPMPPGELSQYFRDHPDRRGIHAK